MELWELYSGKAHGGHIRIAQFKLLSKARAQQKSRSRVFYAPTLHIHTNIAQKWHELISSLLYISKT